MTVFCKLCGDDLPGSSLPEIGGAILDHLRLFHPEQWAELKAVLDPAAARLRN